MAEVDSKRPALVQKPMKTMRWMRDDEPSPEKDQWSQTHPVASKHASVGSLKETELRLGVLNERSPGTWCEYHLDHPPKNRRSPTENNPTTLNQKIQDQRMLIEWRTLAERLVL